MVGTRISVTAGLSMAFRKSCAISPGVDTRTPCGPKDNAKRSNAIGPSELAVGTPNWRIWPMRVTLSFAPAECFLESKAIERSLSTKESSRRRKT